MASHLQESGWPRAHDLYIFPFSAQYSHLEQHRTVPTPRQVSQFEAAYQSHYPYFPPGTTAFTSFAAQSLPPVLSHFSVPMANNQITPTKNLSQRATFNSFNDDWNVPNDYFLYGTDYNGHASTHGVKAMITGTGFMRATSEPASFHEAQLHPLKHNVEAQHKMDAPRSQPFVYAGNPLPLSGMPLVGSTVASPVYEPSLSVSPQDVFPNASLHITYTSSPALSAQDGGYLSADESNSSHYGGDSPLNQAHSDCELDDLHLPVGLLMGYPTALQDQHLGLKTQTQVEKGSPFADDRGFDTDLLFTRSQPCSDPSYADSAYAATDSGDEGVDTTLACRERREAQNRFLVTARRAGKPYKEIRALGNFREAESTLRGRFRDLTKRKNERVRKPVWTRRDVKLLTTIVDDVLETSHYIDRVGPKDDNAVETALARVPWKKVSAYIVENGGTYHFASATCKKKYKQVHRIA